MSYVVVIFFFFKQKTAYEMRISDWSSDVCSSDLDHLDDVAVPFEELGHGHGIAAMLANAQRQRLQPLQEQEGVEGAERVAEVALQRDARLEDVGDRPERLHRLGPHRAVVARLGLVQPREALGVLLPVEGHRKSVG